MKTTVILPALQTSGLCIFWLCLVENPVTLRSARRIRRRAKERKRGYLKKQTDLQLQSVCVCVCVRILVDVARLLLALAHPLLGQTRLPWGWTTAAVFGIYLQQTERKEGRGKGGKVRTHRAHGTTSCRPGQNAVQKPCIKHEWTL